MIDFGSYVATVNFLAAFLHLVHSDMASARVRGFHTAPWWFQWSEIIYAFALVGLGVMALVVEPTVRAVAGSTAVLLFAASLVAKSLWRSRQRGGEVPG